jgi:DEAD/DEAH box helicase domain-containing protein
VSEADVDYYTQPLKEVSVAIIETLDTLMMNEAKCVFGEVEVTEQYSAYTIKHGNTIIGTEPLNLPPLTFRTKAFWLHPSPDTEHTVAIMNLDFAGGLHGAEHAIIALMPLHVMCDRWDIGGFSLPSYGQNGVPTIFIYDGYEGGIGLAEKAFRILPALVSTTYALVRDCPCDEGCPSCIYSPKCGNDNQPLDKTAALRILRDMCSQPEKEWEKRGSFGCTGHGGSAIREIS